MYHPCVACRGEQRTCFSVYDLHAMRADIVDGVSQLASFLKGLTKCPEGSLWCHGKNKENNTFLFIVFWGQGHPEEGLRIKFFRIKLIEMSSCYVNFGWPKMKILLKAFINMLITYTLQYKKSIQTRDEPSKENEGIRRCFLTTWHYRVVPFAPLAKPETSLFQVEECNDI